MSIKVVATNLASNAKHYAKLSKFVVRQKSPEILLGAGIIAGGACIFLACKGTLKAKPKIDDMSIKLEDLEHIESFHTEAIAADPTADEEDEHNLAELKKQIKKEKRHIIAKTAVEVSKDYIPAFVIGMASIGCVLASYKILDKRLLGATVAYESVNAAFNRYRHKVIDKFGEEVEKELYYGQTVREEEVEEPILDEEGNETGETKTVKKVVPNVEKDAPWFSVYSRTLHNRSYQPGLDVDQVRRIQNYLNDELQRNGFMLLNDVYKALEMDIKGDYVGVGWIAKWAADKIGMTDYTGDDFIDFGVFGDHISDQAKLWREGKTNSVILDFNVDGPIYKHINNILETKKDDPWSESARIFDNEVNRRPYYHAIPLHV